jgi:hypothetical protein
MELHYEIVGFTVSHNHGLARIYACYAVIDGSKTTYYRHLIHKFDFIALDGKDKWTAYMIIMNIYHEFGPMQLKRTCPAIDRLPNFRVARFPNVSGLSQGLESHYVSQPLHTNSTSLVGQVIAIQASLVG